VPPKREHQGLPGVAEKTSAFLSRATRGKGQVSMPLRESGRTRWFAEETLVVDLVPRYPEQLRRAP